MSKRAFTMPPGAKPDDIAIPADPNDPEDFDVTYEAVERGLRERHERLAALGIKPKKAISIRLDGDIIEHFRAGGPGWQSRMNEALRKAMG